MPEQSSQTEPQPDYLFVFAGNRFYPSGGAEDFKGAFTDLNEAFRLIAKISCDWWHIAHLTKGGKLRVIDAGVRGPYAD